MLLLRIMVLPTIDLQAGQMLLVPIMTAAITGHDGAVVTAVVTAVVSDAECRCKRLEVSRWVVPATTVVVIQYAEDHALQCRCHKQPLDD